MKSMLLQDRLTCFIRTSKSFSSKYCVFEFQSYDLAIEMTTVATKTSASPSVYCI